MHPLFINILSPLNPSVAIVILNWNGRNYLEKFLPSVMATTYEGAVVVLADNASTDDSVEFVRNNFPSVRILSNPQNFGFARGYNEILKQLNEPYWVLLNSDVEVQPSWLEPMAELMESDQRIAACQPKILQYNDREYFEYAGAAGGWLDSLGYPFARGRIFDICEKDKGQYNEPMPVFWASGAALMVRAAAYREAGGLDEYFFAHQEEIDLCWRLQRLGYMVYCHPGSVVYHVGGGTLPKGNERKVFLNFRNNLMMMWKNLPLGEALWKIFFRYILDTISAVKQLLAGEGTYFRAVFKAHTAFLYWLFFVKKKKLDAPKKVKLEGYMDGSVVWSHFVQGKKRFEEIIGRKD